MIHELMSENAAFVRDMKHNDTCESQGRYDEAPRVYCGAEPPRLCSNENSTRETCERSYFDCTDCIAEDEVVEMQQYDLDQELRAKRRRRRDF